MLVVRRNVPIRVRRIVLAGPDRAGDHLGIRAHRAELKNGKWSAVDPHALLPVEHGSGRAEMHKEGDEQKDGRKGEEENGRDAQIHQPLRDTPPAGEGIALECQKGETFVFGQLHVAGQHFEDIRNHHELDVETFAVRDEIEQALMFSRPERNEDHADAPASYELCRVRDRAQMRQAGELQVRVAGSVGEIPGNVESEGWMTVETDEDIVGKSVVADDHRGPQEASAPVHFPLK